MTDKRADLRRQWAEDNKARQREGLQPLKWREWVQKPQTEDES